MKKIKLKSLVDRTSNTNIDDIYSDICKELGINNDKNNIIKQIESKTKNSKTPLKYSVPIKKNDEDLLLSMTKRLNIVEQNLKESNLKLKKKDEEIIKLNIKIKELEKIKKEEIIEILMIILDVELIILLIVMIHIILKEDKIMPFKLTQHLLICVFNAVVAMYFKLIK